MKIAPLPTDEIARLQSLQELRVLDTQNERQFDALVRLAALVCDVPISLISLIDTERQWFKANIGLDGVTQTHRDFAFCSHAILDHAIMEVRDATKDARFADNPLVTGSPHIRFYAGAPISLSDGHRVGTLCVIDRQSRKLVDYQKEILTHLAHVCSSLLEGRRFTQKVKETANELRDSETFSRALIEAIPDDVLTIRNDGICISAHVSEHSLLLSTSKALVGQHILTIFAAALANNLKIAIDETLTSGTVREIAGWVSGPAGFERYAEIRVARSFDDAVVCIFRENTDRELDRRFRENYAGQISERLKLTENELREREQLIAIVVEAISLGYWSRSLHSDEVIASEHWRRLFGFNLNEPIRLTKLMERIHPDDIKPFLECLKQAVENGEIYNSTYRIILPDGEIRWIRSRGRIQRTNHNGEEFLRGISFDVTDLKKNEFELEQKRQEVTFLARVATLGELSGAIAHELNQPLMSMLLNTESAQFVLKQKNIEIPALNDILNDLVEENIRAGRIIQRLRQMFDNRSAQRQSICVNELIKVVQNILRNDLINRQTMLEIDAGAGEATINVDRVQIEQVLVNLINNAAESMAVVNPNQRKIVLQTALIDQTTVRVSVRDQGGGIPFEALDRVFEPFFTTKKHGMGLGLSICKNIVSANGGRIWAENKQKYEPNCEPNCGAVFHFSFPLVHMQE